MNTDDMQPNPLIPLVLHVLRASALPDADAGISEYDLLKAVEAEAGSLAATAANADLQLFQRHFLLMNALYQLQDRLWREEGVWLTISPLRIAIEQVAAKAAGQALDAAAHTGLRDYYLDWREFETTDGDAVAALLNTFWQRLYAHDGRAAALMALELDADAGWDDIQRQYRRLAAATHPDRGGDGERFLAVREAYELLRAALGR